MGNRCAPLNNRCFPWCFDVYMTKVNYRIDPNRDLKQKSFEDLLRTNYYNIEDIQKIINKNQVLFETKSVILDYKLKQNYDDKYLYTPLDKMAKVGDIFYWPRTNTHWIVYAEYLTEKSYYKCIIKKADWCISWKDDNEVIQYQWVYVRGPVETKTKDIVMKSKIYDIPNATLTILMPATAKTKYFKKYSELMLNGKKWQVAADVDDISNPGLVELQLIKVAADYNDDKENNIVDGNEDITYTMKKMFEDVIIQNSVINVNNSITLYKNGEIIPSNFSIENIAGSGVINGTNISFPYMEPCTFKVIYNLDKNINTTYRVEVVSSIFNTPNYNYIIGPSTIRSLLQYEYSTEHIGNTRWVVDDPNKLVRNIEYNNRNIYITTGSKTGNFTLNLYDTSNLVDSLNINIISTFE